MGVYLENNGQQFGPFELAQARSYIGEGRFAPTDRAWMDGMGDWQEIRAIASLASALPVPVGNPYSTPPVQAAAPAYPGNNYAAPGAALQFNQYAASDTEYAGFWRRCAGLMIDSLIFGIVWMFFSMIFGIALAFTNSMALVGLMYLVGGSLWVGYFVFWQRSSSMATPGKMAMGCIVVDNNGQQLSLGACIIREVLKLVSSVVLYLLHWTQPFSAQRQTIYDMAGGSVVLRRSPDAGAPSWAVWLINLIPLGFGLLISIFVLVSIGSNGFR
jgi:uncharacterized RDD family membrane protein YckC